MVVGNSICSDDLRREEHPPTEYYRNRRYQHADLPEKNGEARIRVFFSMKQVRHVLLLWRTGSLSTRSGRDLGNAWS